MIAIILLTVFGGLFAAMALAPLAIEESERAEAERRRAVRPVSAPTPARRSVARDQEPVAA
ncbi:MAG TPA: hypothetical protein VNP95_03635 [Thermomicrobiales bacterium]|nr:hypothetical protein [Thermomicrobiales bacterium]